MRVGFRLPRNHCKKSKQEERIKRLERTLQPVTCKGTWNRRRVIKWYHLALILSHYAHATLLPLLWLIKVFKEFLHRNLTRRAIEQRNRQHGASSSVLDAKKDGWHTLHITDSFLFYLCFNSFVYVCRFYLVFFLSALRSSSRQVAGRPGL